MSKVRFVGLDVHAESIVIAVADAGTAPAEIWKSVAFSHPRLLAELKKLGRLNGLKVCYEAGPTGFGLQRFLACQGIDCVIVAPSLVPQTSGSRVKTDRRDARKLAHFLRSGDLTAVWIPDEPTEALRDLERAREDARIAERRARQQLLKFLLRHERRYTEGTSHWTVRHWAWVRRQTFDQPASQRVLEDYVQTVQQATQRVRQLTQDIQECVPDWALAPVVKNLQAFRGLQLVTATGVTAEVGNFERFQKASQFMAFMGLVPSENSSGKSRRQGGITKTGNRHVRRLLTEAAWHYYDCPAGISAALAKRREGVSAEVVAIAEKAQRRLRRKAYNLRRRAMPPNKIVTALARELAGFLWAAARATAAIAPGKREPLMDAATHSRKIKERTTGKGPRRSQPRVAAMEPTR
jgi:transposase